LRPTIDGTIPVKGSPVVAQPRYFTQTMHVPTCSGNSGTDSGVVCTAAVETCPEVGEIRFWLFTREYDLIAGAPVGPYVRVMDPPSVCLGADDPVIDPTVAIPALVERDFQSVVVVKGVADVSPRPETLVNIPTIFTTSTPGGYDIPLTLLGQPVTITASAQRYTWYFGDGETASSTESGGRVEHVYLQAATREAYVVIEWGGSFTINGGPAQPINGTATTTRTELVRD
jgi:hypothetical protein